MHQERRAGPELEQATTEVYAETFFSRRDRYSIQLADGRYASINQQLSLHLVSAHLKGNITLGTYALDENSQSRWICFDADTDRQWKALVETAAALSLQDVATYLELSRRGGHLWLLTPSLPAEKARQLAQQLARERNLRDIEIFPKQDRLVIGPGSLVRLPLGVHRITGYRYPFIKPDGTPLASTVRDQVRLLASPRRVPHSFIEQVLSRRPRGDDVSSTPLSRRLHVEGQDALPSNRIKQSISVYDFVSRFVDLDQRGVGRCPFHDDQHPSFSVNASENYWHCFAGCGGGDVIHFWSKWRELHDQDPDFTATITDLANMLL